MGGGCGENAKEPSFPMPPIIYSFNKHLLTKGQTLCSGWVLKWRCAPRCTGRGWIPALLPTSQVAQPAPSLPMPQFPHL